MLIGLSGKKQHGKSTVAEYLRSEYGFYTVSWAAPLKNIIGSSLFGFSTDQLYDNELKEKVDPFWGMSPRKALQIVGTDCFRDKICDDFWIRLGVRTIKKILHEIPYAHIVVPDCRFTNEADAIKKLDGKMIRVVKEDAPVTDTHASETELDYYNFDAVWSAKPGDIKKLHSHADLLMEWRG